MGYELYHPKYHFRVEIVFGNLRSFSISNSTAVKDGYKLRTVSALLLAAE